MEELEVKASMLTEQNNQLTNSLEIWKKISNDKDDKIKELEAKITAVKALISIL